MLPLKLNKINLPVGSNGIVAKIYYKNYYDPIYTLLAVDVPILSDGSIQASPPVQFNIDPTLKYMIKVENELCGIVYEQAVILNPYCEIGYELSGDSTYCFKEEISQAIPPSNPEITVDKSGISYGTCGTYIYALGYNINGTGTSSQIPTGNSFWTNGIGNCVDSGTTNGPVNRAALWSTSTTDNQDIGFSVCLSLSETAIYYVGIAVDNYGLIDLDGVNVITQNETALNAQYSITGICFKAFHLYPVSIPAGSHVLTCIGHNVSGSAALAVEIFANTAAEIIAATAYANLNVIFSSKDYIGQQVQVGTGGTGYSCVDPDAFVAFCDSPVVCKKITITNIKY